MHKALIPLAIAALLASAAQAQSVTKLSPSKANDYGLVYSLPYTVLDITIETEYTEKQPGEFYNYARRNLNISDAITSPSQTAMVKSITIVPRGEADTANRWLMQFKSGQSIFVVLNDANLPVAINVEKVPAAPVVELPQPRKSQPTPLETEAYRQAVTQDMTLSSSASKRAQLATERIFELRENRNDLISGQAENTPPDGKSLQLALDNLSAQEAALTAMFAGTTRTWTQVNTITYVPDSVEVSNQVIARLSPIKGLVDADDLSGEPIYLSMSILSKGEEPLDDKGLPRPFPKNGIAYNIPGTALFSISYDGAEIASQQIDITQLGITYGLDPKIFTDKKSPAYLLLNPINGAILTLAIKDI